MNIKLHHMTLATVTTIATLANTIGVGFANPQIKGIPINQPTINRMPVDQIKLNPTTIYGEVTVEFGHYASKGSLQCKDLSVGIYSDEKQPSPPAKPGEIQLPGAPVFSYSRKLSGNLNTGKCNYSISTDPKYIGKKAYLNFLGGGDYNDGAKPVTIPSQPTKMDTKVVFGRIG